MSNVGQRPASNGDELLSAFKIGHDDLLANRAGLLSTRQKGLLRASAGWNILGAAVIVIGLCAAVYAFGARPFTWYQYLLVGLLAVGGAATGFFTVRGLLRATRAGVVECVAGPVSLHLRRNNGWWLTVQQRSYRLPVQFWHVGSGAPYRVYVVPAANRIVAMEPIA